MSQKIIKLIKSGKLDAALALVEKTTGITPADKNNLVGIIALKKGDVARAISSFEKAVALNGSIMEFQANLANAYMRGGFLNEAQKVLEFLLSYRVAQTAEIYCQYGDVFLFKKKFEESLKNYRLAETKKTDFDKAKFGIISSLCELALQKNYEGIDELSERIQTFKTAKEDKEQFQTLKDKYSRIAVLYALDHQEENEVVKVAEKQFGRTLQTYKTFQLSQSVWDVEKPFTDQVRDLKDVDLYAGSYDWYVAQDQTLFLKDMENGDPLKGHFVKAISSEKCLMEVPRETHKVSEKTFLLGGGPNYYHWLIDYLPRLSCLKDQDIKIATSPLRPYQMDALHHLGIEEERLLFLKEGQVYHMDHLISPLCAAHDAVIHPECLAWLKREFNLVEKPQKPRRIYINRTQTGQRDIKNLKEITPVLEKYDVEIIHAEKLSFKEQATLFNQTDLVIAPHGAGLSNMVFATDAKIIELTPFIHSTQNFFSRLAKSCGHDHQFLQAVASPTAQQVKTVHPNNYNMNVQPSVLEKAILDMLER